jgi:cell division protein FtsB
MHNILRNYYKTPLHFVVFVNSAQMIVEALQGKAGDVLVRRSSRKKLTKFTVIALLVLTIAACSILGYRTAALKAEAKQYERQLSELKTEKKQLDDNKKNIEEYKKYVKSDEFVEKTARQKLGLVKPGEIVFEPDSSDN